MEEMIPEQVVSSLIVCLFMVVASCPRTALDLGVVITIMCPFPVKPHAVGTLVKTVALG